MRYSLFFLVSFLLLANYSAAKGKQDNGTFVSPNNEKSFNTDNSKDVHELANSIQFDVYKITETSSSHSTFESAAGICYGYRELNGVNMTNITANYLEPGNKQQYYGNVVGMVFSDKDGVNNIRTSPVYVINDKATIERLKKDAPARSQKNLKNNIENGQQILSGVVCK